MTSDYTRNIRDFQLYEKHTWFPIIRETYVLYKRPVPLVEQEFYDAKEVIRSSNSKDNTHPLSNKKKDKRTNNYLQYTTQKTIICERRTSLKSVGELGCSGRVSSPRTTGDMICRVILVTNPVISPIVFIYLMNFPTWNYIVHVW